MANRSSFHLILLNLLTNAFKFVAPDQVPSVTLRAERRGESVRLWVEDNGIGIPEEDIGKLFNMFRRLNPNEYPGTGMGLAIVKKAAERMGGRVGVDSTRGKGSRFWVELKAAPPNQQTHPITC
jgi:signal transduction histidine kinase